MNLPLAEGLIFTTGCAVGSLFPDIDHESSTVGKRVKPLSSLLHKTVGHRTLFHWFVPYCLLAVVLHLWKPSWDVVTMAVLIGVLTHLFLDALNPSGVPVFPGLKLNLLKIKTESGFRQGDWDPCCPGCCGLLYLLDFLYDPWLLAVQKPSLL